MGDLKYTPAPELLQALEHVTHHLENAMSTNREFVVMARDSHCLSLCTPLKSDLTRSPEHDLDIAKGGE